MTAPIHGPLVGRATVLARIRDWLEANSSGLLVVTGEAGTGKSAVLRELAAGRAAGPAAPAPGAPGRAQGPDDAATSGRPDAAPRAQGPDDAATSGRPDAAPPAISARDQTVSGLDAEIAARLASANAGELGKSSAGGLGGTATRPDDLAQALQAAHERTLLIDALDEAASPAGAACLLRDLADAGARIVVAARRDDAEPSTAGTPPAEHALGARGSALVDLQDPYLAAETHADVAAYVAARLTEASTGSPYAAHPEDARVIGDAVAYRVGGVFLYARWAVRRLATLPRLEPKGAWRQAIPAIVGREALGEAVEQDLERLPAAELERVRGMLMALAWAHGEGVPRQRVWPAMAEAVTGAAYDDDDVHLTLAQAPGHVVETDAAGRAAYRLSHDELARHFRQEAEREYGAGIGRRIAERLRALAGPGDASWLDADPYMLRHLAAHGHVAELLGDPGFVAAAQPDSLERGLAPLAFGAAEDPVPALARACLRTWEQHRPPHPSSRLATIALQARAAEPGATVWAEDSAIPHAWRTTTAAVRAAPFSRVLRGHRNWVWGVACAEVGDRLLAASASADTTLRVWDPVMAETVAILPGHRGGASDVAFGVVEGRPVLASSGFDRTVRLWDLATGQQVGVLEGHRRGLWGVSFGAVDGRDVLASAGADYTVRLWDAVSGQPLGQFDGHEDWAWTATFGTVEGQVLLASASDDGTARVWDPSAMRPVSVLQGHKGAVSSVAFGEADGRAVLASASFDHTIRLWDPLEARTLAVLEGHTDWVRSVVFGSIEGRDVLVSAGDDHTVRLWDLDRPGPLAVMAGHELAATTVAIGHGPAGSMIVSAGFDRTLRAWNAAACLAASATGHERARREATSGVGASGEAAPGDATPGDATPGNATSGGGTPHEATPHEATPGDPTSGAVTGLSFGKVADRAALAVVRDQGAVEILDADRGSVLATVEAHSDWGRDVALGVDEGRAVLAVADLDGAVRLHDPATGRVLHQAARHELGVSALALASTGAGGLLASAGLDSKVRLWEVATQTLHPPLEGHADWVWHVAFGDVDGALRMASASADHTVRLWDPLAREHLETLRGHDDGVSGVAFGEVDGKACLVSAGIDGRLLLWDPATGRSNGQLGHHESAVRAVAFADAGGLPVVASVGDDGLMRLWDPLGGGSVAVPLLGAGRCCASAGPRVAVGTDSGLIAIELTPALAAALGAPGP